MGQKTIGVMQVCVGYLVLLITIISAFWITEVYLQGIFSSVDTLSYWSEAAWKVPAEQRDMFALERVDWLVTQANIYRTTAPIFLLLVLLLAAVSVFMILEGVKNIHLWKESERGKAQAKPSHKATLKK